MAISSIKEGEDSFVAVANYGDKYSFESDFSSQVKTEFEKLKREEQLVTVALINRP
ncbi:MAG: hypothetical protein QG670_733 [Thermoproteota archaeon]|nr:hypothetical protein [Thermoproteota archaeon]